MTVQVEVSIKTVDTARMYEVTCLDVVQENLAKRLESSLNEVADSFDASVEKVSEVPLYKDNYDPSRKACGHWYALMRAFGYTNDGTNQLTKEGNERLGRYITEYFCEAFHNNLEGFLYSDKVSLEKLLEDLEAGPKTWGGHYTK